MLDFSFFELLLISLITLIVVGPDRLPTVARTIGFWVGRGRAMVTSLRTEFEREVNVTGIKETERHLRKEFAETDQELRDATRADEAKRSASGGGVSPNDVPSEGELAESSTSSEAEAASAPADTTQTSHRGGGDQA